MINIIAFDVYDTIYHPGKPIRPSFLEFAVVCRDRGITLVTSSDGETPWLIKDLQSVGVPEGVFYDYYQMCKWEPKNYQPILDFFNIASQKLLVIGNSLYLDIEPAIELGCHAILVPSYEHNDDFSIMYAGLAIIDSQ